MDHIEKILTEVQETMDDFVFWTIYHFCTEVLERKISKQLIKNALIEYRRNHPELFEEGEEDERKTGGEEVEA